MTTPNDDDPDSYESSLRRELEEIQTRLSFIEETLRNKQRSGVFGNSNRSILNRLPTALLGVLGALVLGGAIMFFIRGFQWRSALAELRAEPGIQIMSVRSVGLLKKRVTGLRDPLAPNPYKILQDHNIPPGQVDLQLTEYHSLNTPYGRQREEQRTRELLELRGKVIGVVGTLSEENRKLREDELGRISQLLLEIRFPEAMKKLNLQYNDGVWHADGQLLANEYSDFKQEASKYILNGAVDLDNIRNYTQARSDLLIRGIQSANLLDKDYAGEPAHIPRLARLIKEYDDLCVKSGVTPGRLKLILTAKFPETSQGEANKIADKLTDAAQLSETRIRMMPPQTNKDEKMEDTLKIEIGD